MNMMDPISAGSKVPPSSRNMMDASSAESKVPPSSENLSSFEAPGKQEPVSGTMVASIALFEAPDEQEPVSGTTAASSMLFEAPGKREPVSGTMAASSMVDMIDEEVSRPSMLGIGISDEQIAVVRQAIERSEIQAETADASETVLRSLLNPDWAATVGDAGPRPYVTKEQVRRAQSNDEKDFMNHQAMAELMEEVMKLECLHVFKDQQVYESGESLPDELHATVLKKKMNLTTGVWNDVDEIVEWPDGVAGILSCINKGGCANLIQILEAFANFAENTLKTPMGRVRYLLGLPLTYDTMRSTTRDVQGLSATGG
jgi:hypothetical protein